MWGAMRCDGCDGCLVRPSSSWPSTILWGSEQASLGGIYIYIYTYIYLYKHVAQKGKAICVYHISTEMCVCVYFTEYIYIYIRIY